MTQSKEELASIHALLEEQFALSPRMRNTSIG